jgi:hypothetical protein
MSKLDTDLLGEAVNKILAYSQGKEVDGKKGKVRNFTETIELQVRIGKTSRLMPKDVVVDAAAPVSSCALASFSFIFISPIRPFRISTTHTGVSPQL